MGKPLPPIADEERRHSDHIGSGPVGFGASIPGMRTAPVEHKIRAATRAQMAKTPEVWKSYNELSRNLRIVNRAQKGPMKGHPFAIRVDGVIWPEGADPEGYPDPDTWLQPGEYMDVPKDVALHICGNVWDKNLPNKMDIVQKYGDWQYEEQNQGVGRMAPMVRVGPPDLPDLVVCELDGRSNPKGDWKPIFELYMRGEKLVKDLSVTSEKLAKAPVEPFEVVDQGRGPKVVNKKKVVTTG